MELARSDFQAIINQYPEHAKANYYMGISYYSSNEFNKAIKLFTNVNHTHQEHNDSVYYRGIYTY